MKKRTTAIFVILLFVTGLIFAMLALAGDDGDEKLSCRGKCKVASKPCLEACDKVNKNINDVCHKNCMGDFLKCKSKCPK